MNKREPASDVPRRIYVSTIKRIDKYLEYRPRPLKKGKQMGTKKHIKGDFNVFLEHLIDVYDRLEEAYIYAKKNQVSSTVYVVNGKVYDDAMDARGAAIQLSVKSKNPVKWPDVYVYIGSDEE